MSAVEPSSVAEFKQQWLARWRTMAPRERQLVLAAAWLTALVLLVMLAIRPAVKTLRETPAQLAEVNAQLDEMNRFAAEAVALKQLPPVPPAQAKAALEASIDRLGDGAKLSSQGDRITVVLKSVSGGDLLDWLTEVRSSARVRPLEADLEEVEPGVYNGSIALALPAGAPR